MSSTISSSPDATQNHQNWNDMISSSDFLQQAEAVIFTPQQPDFTNEIYIQQVRTQKSIKEQLLALLGKPYGLVKKISKHIGRVTEKALVNPNIPELLKYGVLLEAKQLLKRVQPKEIKLPLPELCLHANAGKELVNGVDKYTPEKLESLRHSFPNVTVKQETYSHDNGTTTNAFSAEQIYTMYATIAAYGDKLKQDRIEVRPTKEWKLLSFAQNTMRTVTVPAKSGISPSFKGKLDMLLTACKGVNPNTDRIQVTRFNTNEQKNIASVKNLEELECSLAGIYGHELAHVRQGIERGHKEKWLFMVKYLTNKRRRTDLEKMNDAEAVLMGHGLDLYKFKMIVDANSEPQFVRRKFEEYLVPKQLLRLTFYVEQQYRTLHGKGYFATEILDEAWKLLQDEDRKNIDQYKFTS